MGEVVPARTSPTLHPPSPPTVHQLPWLALYHIACSWCQRNCLHFTWFQRTWMHHKKSIGICIIIQMSWNLQMEECSADWHCIWRVRSIQTMLYMRYRKVSWKLNLSYAVYMPFAKINDTLNQWDSNPYLFVWVTNDYNNELTCHKRS